MQKFIHTKFFKIIIIAALFLLLIFLNPSDIFKPVRSGFLASLKPFQKFFYSFSVGINNIKEFIISIDQLKSENEQLIRDNQVLLFENASISDIKNENTTLREQLNLIPRDKYDLSAAFIVSYDPSGTGNWLEIDKGSEDGIFPGMPVIVSKGIIIGRIYEVNRKSSQVMLLTNPKSTVNIIDVESGAKGVAKGEYGLGIIFDMVLQTDSISIGDSVITSGIGGEIPRGLYVGTIQEIHQSEDHLFQQAVLTAPLQISNIRMVFVIKNNK
ncbi:MAG TPA: rod shape-determining protein MreC [Candidatus Moranbacteria bacterium]|nr:rod shape-determining protein MreC [Candidatus Moranbacteria bacterium]HRZ33744.1 rod shape-determining protein MreC [Candidatus Moranbacteria bacterium]